MSDFDTEDRLVKILMGESPSDLTGVRGQGKGASMGDKINKTLADTVTVQLLAKQWGITPDEVRQMLGAASEDDEMEQEIFKYMRLAMKMKMLMPILNMIGGDNQQQRPQESRTDKLIDVQILKLIGDDKARQDLFQSQAQTANERIHDKDSFYQTLLDHQKSSNEQTDKLRAEIITKSQELMMEKQNSVIRELEKAIKEGKQDDISKLGEKIGNYRNAYENLGKMFGKNESSFLQDLIALFSNKDVSKVITRAIDEIGAGIGKVSQQTQVPANRTLIPPPPPPPPRRIINPPPPPPPQGQP